MKLGSKLQRAMLGIAHAVLFSDSKMRPEEAGWVFSVARKNHYFRDLTDEDFAMTIAAVMEEWNSAPLKVVMDRWIGELSAIARARPSPSN